MANELFGWDLLYKSVENDIQKKEDVLVAFTHWFLIKIGFTCLGNGTSRTLKGDEIKSEALPPQWNRLNDFNLRYITNDKIYLFRGTVTNGDIIFNFLRADDLSISSCMFQLDTVVRQLKGDINKVIPDYRCIIEVLDRELVSPIYPRSKQMVGTQTLDTGPLFRRDPMANELMRPQRRQIIRPVSPEREINWNPLRDPRGIGRNDVDPLARGIGGGMIFDPFRPVRGPGPNFPGLPRGAVPPGARFDPFAPPGSGRGGRPDPDPDHLPPPGYDDMFM